MAAGREPYFGIPPLEQTGYATNMCRRKGLCNLTISLVVFLAGVCNRLCNRQGGTLAHCSVGSLVGLPVGARDMELLHSPAVCPVLSFRAGFRPAGRQSRWAVAVAAPEKQQQPLQQSDQLSANGFVPGLNTYSRVITQPKTQGGSQAMLYATGLSDQDMHKAQVNMALRRQQDCQAAPSAGVCFVAAVRSGFSLS